MTKLNFELKTSWDVDSFEKAFDELEAELEAAARGITVLAWDSILARTPQYTGAMAASWTYSIGNPIEIDRSHAINEEEIGAREINGRWVTSSPKGKGDFEAIEVSNVFNIGNDSAFRLGDVVYIANGVDGDDGPYSAGVEDGSIQLRAVNLPGAPIARTLDMIEARFATDMSDADARQLKQLRIGAFDAS